MSQQNAEDRAFFERLIAMRADHVRNNAERGPVNTDLRAETRRQLDRDRGAERWRSRPSRE